MPQDYRKKYLEGKVILLQFIARLNCLEIHGGLSLWYNTISTSQEASLETNRESCKYQDLSVSSCANATAFQHV